MNWTLGAVRLSALLSLQLTSEDMIAAFSQAVDW